MTPGHSGNLGHPARMDMHRTDDMRNDRALISPNQKSQPLIGKKLQTTQINHRRKRIISFGGHTTNIHAHSSGGNLLNSTNSRISAHSPRGVKRHPGGHMSNLNIVPETEGSVGGHNYDYNIQHQILGSPRRRTLNRQSGMFDKSNSPAGSVAGRNSHQSFQAQQHKLRQASNRKTAELKQLKLEMEKRSLPKKMPLTSAQKQSEKELGLYRNRVLIDR